jgi:integrase
VSAASLRVAARSAMRCEHVFGGRVVDAETARWAARVDSVFLAEVGWDEQQLMLFPPADHPLLGRPVCRALGCEATASVAGRVCVSCRRRLAEDGLVLDEIGRLPARPRSRQRQGPSDCLVGGCARQWVSAPAGLCRSHLDLKRSLGLDLARFLAHPSTRPLEACEPCAVTACPRQRRHRGSVYCEPHQIRWREARDLDSNVDEKRWQRTEPAVSVAGQVSLRGLAPLVTAQVLLGLQQRCRLSGVKTKEADLRAFCNELRASQAKALTDYRGLSAHRDQGFTGMVNSLTLQASRAMSSPEIEVSKDVWDLVVFGHNGTLDFSVISQRWLREIAKRWAADDLPRRRVRPGRRTSVGLNVRHHIGCVALLSGSLRRRPDRGERPAALCRADMETFLHRLSYLESVGRISGDARIRACREVRAVLTRARALGLTRAGAPAAGLGEDFALHRDDIPAEPQPGEPGRDLPNEILRQVCAHLPAISSAEMRTGIELAIDTGRRPEEICDLRYDCLARDDDGAPVLVYHNHKANRLDRRLPINEATATLIAGQQKRVRARYPRTLIGELKLLPTDRRNPDGAKAITAFSLAFHHRKWVNTIPDLRTADGAEFDRQRVVLYAYRHSYAQRHADVGVPIDVLRQLMDHSKLDTTKQYYHVGDARRREAVDRVTAMQFDRHGNRVWRDAKVLLDSEHARRAVGEVAVPFGLCAEPSNVKAGGGACPYRFRCAGCDHFRTDVSYLPDLHAYLDDLLRTRERLRAATDIDAWARAEATPSNQEITRIRRLIKRITGGLDELTPADRAQVNNAVATVRRHRAVMLGMPRTRPALPDLRPGATA